MSSDAYWVGRFAVALAHAIPQVEKRPRDVHDYLKATLGEFMRSHPDEQLQRSVRKEMIR
jgi:hypothetical protein